MVLRVLPVNGTAKTRETPPESESYDGDACPLCAGFYTEGPRKGEPYPPCLSCRDEARRLAGLHDPRMLVRPATATA